MAARLDRELRSRSAAAHVPGPRGPRAARGDAAARDQGAERRHLLPAVDDLGNAPQRPLVARRHPAQPARHGGAAALLGQAGRPAGLGPAAPPRSAARRSGVEAPRPGRIRRFSLRPVDLAALSLPDLASDRASGCGGRREEARRPPAAGRQPVREGRVRPRRQVPPEPASPEPVGFYAQMARDAAKRGALALGFLELAGRRIAGHLSVVHAGRHYLLKLGYDESFHEHSPGQQLTSEMIRDACQRGLSEFDFLGPCMDWKLDWEPALRIHTWLTIFRPTPVGRLVHEARYTAWPVARALAGRLLRRAHLGDAGKGS